MFSPIYSSILKCACNAETTITVYCPSAYFYRTSLQLGLCCVFLRNLTIFETPEDCKIHVRFCVRVDMSLRLVILQLHHVHVSSPLVLIQQIWYYSPYVN